MRAKYIYLICLYEASRSTRYPFWFRSQKDMSKLYGISDNTISSALLELEEKGIIEVTRDKPTPPDFVTHRFVTSNQGMGTGAKLMYTGCFCSNNNGELVRLRRGLSNHRFLTESLCQGSWLNNPDKRLLSLLKILVNYFKFYWIRFQSIRKNLNSIW